MKTTEAFEVTGIFTDRHGISHIDPVFSITYYHKSSNDYLHGSLGTAEDGSPAYTEEPVVSDKQCQYNVQYWTNADAKDAGMEPIQFVMDGNTSVYFQLETNPTTHSGVRQACKTHFETTILPDYLEAGE